MFTEAMLLAPHCHNTSLADAAPASAQNAHAGMLYLPLIALSKGGSTAWKHALQGMAYSHSEHSSCALLAALI